MTKLTGVKTDITKDDSSSADQLREAFRGLAGEKVHSFYHRSDWKLILQPYITELDFKFASLPPETVRFLSEVMPVTEQDPDQSDGSSHAYDCKSHD